MVGLEDRPNIRLINIRNPFDAMNSREFKDVPAGLTLKECIDLVRNPLDDCYYVASVNGQIVPKGTDYSLIHPKGNVVLCATPQGGGNRGGGKNTGMMILEAVVVIIAAIVTIYAGGYGAYAMASVFGGMWSVSSCGLAMGMAVAVAGSLLVSLLFAPDSANDNNQSSTYGWEGSGNANREGIVWPVLYGTMRITPPIIGKYIEVVDDKQYLNVLYAIADHPIDSIDNASMLMNGNTVAKDDNEDNFIDWEVRYGKLNQKPLQYFNDTRTLKASAQPLTKPLDWDDEEDYIAGNLVTFDHDNTVWKCLQACSGVEPAEGAYWTRAECPWTIVDADGTAIEGLGIALSLPYGLYHTHDDGGLGHETVNVEIQYKKEGNVSWTSISTYETSDDLIITAIWSAGYWHHDVWTNLEYGSTNADAHEEGEIYAGMPYVYINDGKKRMRHEWHWVEIGASVKNANTLLQNYVSITEEKTTALRRVFYVDRIPAGAYQVRARFANGICPSNSTRHFNTVYLDYVESIIYDDFSYPGSSVLALRALATDKISGNMPIISFVATRSTVPVWTGSFYTNLPATNPAWASYDILHNSHYGGGVPYSKIIYSDFLAWANNCNTHYISEGVASPTSFKSNIYFDDSTTLRKALNMLGSLGRGNTVQVGSKFTCFVDKLEPTPAQSFLFNMGNISNKSFSLEYLPMTDRANAVDVTFWDKDNDYKQKTLEIHASDFDSTTQEIKKTQITLRGCTSRAEALCHGYFALNCNRLLTTTATFKSDVDAIGCMPWDVIEVQHDVTLWGEGGRIVSAAGSTVVLDKAVTLQPGETYTLRIQDNDDDTKAEYTLNSVPQETTSATVTTTTALSPVPAKYDKWVLTTTGSLTKYFRMIKTTRAGDLTRNLVCIEYNPDVYVDNGTLEPPEEPTAPTYEAHLKAVEVQRWNGSPDTDVHLSWTGFATSWHVFYRKTGDEKYIRAGTTSTPFFRITGLPYGATSYTFCVSHTNNPSDGITATLTVTGHAIGALPQTPTSFTASLYGQTIVLNWALSADVTVIGYTIYLNGTAIVTNYNGDQYVYSGSLAAGIYNFTLCAVTRGGKSDPTAAASITISSPSTPSPSVSVSGEQSVVSWADCKTTLPIDYYTVNGTIVNACTFSERINWTGARDYAVIAYDVCGNASATGTASTSTITVPVTPTGITTTGLTYAIRLDMVYSTFATFSCLEIWSSSMNDRSTAVKVGESAAAAWTHNGLSLVDTRYYWIRTKDVYGNVGAWYPSSATAGVSGTTSTNPADYLTILTGSITEDELATALNTRLNVLDTDEFLIENNIVEGGIFSGLADAYNGLSEAQGILKTSIDEAVQDASDALSTLETLQGEIAGLVTTEWSATGSYVVGNYRTYNNVVYRCIQSYSYPAVKTPGVDTAYWEESDSIATLLTEVESRVDELEGEIVNKVSTTTYNLLEDRVTEAESNITQNAEDILLKVSQTDFDAFSQLFLPDFDEDNTYEVNDYVRYDGDAYVCIATIDFTPAPTPGVTAGWETYWSLSDFAAQFTTMINSVEIATDGITMLSEVITGPVALVENIVETGAVVETVEDIADLDTRISKAQIDVDGANSQILLQAADIDAINNRLTQAKIDIDGANASISLKASISDLNTTNSNLSLVEVSLDAATTNIGLHATRLTNLETTTGTHTTQINQAIIDIDAAEANILLKASIAELTGTVAPVYSAVTTYNTNDHVRYNYSGSLWRLYRCKSNGVLNIAPTNATYWEVMSTVAARMATAESTIDVHDDAIDGLTAQYTVKLNVNNRVAGFGLMLSEDTPSEFCIVAEKFKVIDNSDVLDPKQVFTIGNINGNSAVGINGDLIIDGSILARNIGANEVIANSANIKDAIITSAKISSLTADKISSGTISSKQITLAVAAGTGDSFIAAGKTDFKNTETGFILGLDDSDSDKPKFYIGSSTSYLNWTGSALNMVGDLCSGISPSVNGGLHFDASVGALKLYAPKAYGGGTIILAASLGRTSGYYGIYPTCAQFGNLDNSEYYGIIAGSKTKIGVIGMSVEMPGGGFGGYPGAIWLQPTWTGSGTPSVATQVGVLATNEDGDLFIYKTTGWKKLT